MFKQRASQQQQQRPSAQRTSSSTAATPFCKMCKDAGKKDYGHYMYDSKTKKPTCPYLLTIVCGYCKQQEGHTTKYCPKLPKTQASALAVQQASAVQVQQASALAAPLEPTKKQNRYALFAQQLEEEEQKEKQKEQNAIAFEKAEIEKAKLAEKVAINYANDFPGLPSPKVKRVSKEKRVSFDSNCKSEHIVANSVVTKPSPKSTSSYSNSVAVEQEDWSWRPSENNKSWGF